MEYISSLGLRVLFKAAKQAKAAQQTLLLAGLRPAVKEVFDISGFTGLFTIHPDRGEAVASLR
jgi:anti-sigma B factor antagonist